MIDNVIWAEVHRLKFYERYLDLYLDVLKSRKKWVHSFSLFFLTGGLFGSWLWEYAPLAGVMLTMALQIFAILQEYVAMPASDFAKVVELRLLCVKAFYRFEKLYLNIWYKKLNDEEAIGEFYSVRQEFIEIQNLFSVIDLPPLKKMEKKAAEDTDRYLKSFFNASVERDDAKEA